MYTGDEMLPTLGRPLPSVLIVISASGMTDVLKHVCSLCIRSELFTPSVHRRDSH